jgi:hypothetical protein
MLRITCLFSIVFYITYVFLKSSSKTPAIVPSKAPGSYQNSICTLHLYHISVIILAFCPHQMPAKRVKDFEHNIYIALF